ncbi:hypothetical protein CAFE_03540 [Caprobacter fermentans]|uniref:Uncharacterized protein n=1 Tax=Caproicibacter fermentans TaxID=2576756 RepID=A0A6N8HVH9_9FIRM|nr:hypothetical protein [Caproicibacter fermentans]MVB09689.1 hypothetical protein [Caproicibacter fermentans]QNK40443.1 hypothetical protein HCR03_17635 [Caproicibacter fermentans]
MEKTTAETDPMQPKPEKKRLLKFLEAAVGHFRVGEDNEGMDSFLNAMEELEHAVETDRLSREPQIDLNRLLLPLQRLYLSMRNRDITGLTDLLEDTLIPLTNEWRKGGGEI